MHFELPAEIEWALHRVATSGRYHDSLDTIATRWSLADLFDAHDVLDALEDAEAEAWEQNT